jgi:hypothetical protein
MEVRPDDPRCAALSAEAGEPMAGTAPRADLWVVVEHPEGWGDAGLTRSGHGVRVVLARGSRAACAAARATGRTRVWVADAAGAALRVGTVDDPHEVAGWDLAGLAAGSWRQWGRPDPEPLLLVCANGRRDRCCGHAGGRLAEQLWAGPADAGRILTSTHLGGHRFAPTALLLPWGLLHGRLDEAGAAAILAGAAAGTTPTATLRGHSTLDAPRQVAEVHARQVTGHTGLDPLPVALTGDPAAGRLLARVGPTGGDLAVELARARVGRVASCGRAPEPVEQWVVASAAGQG